MNILLINGVWLSLMGLIGAYGGWWLKPLGDSLINYYSLNDSDPKMVSASNLDGDYVSLEEEEEIKILDHKGNVDITPHKEPEANSQPKLEKPEEKKSEPKKTKVINQKEKGDNKAQTTSPKTSKVKGPEKSKDSQAQSETLKTPLTSTNVSSTLAPNKSTQQPKKQVNTQSPQSRARTTQYRRNNDNYSYWSEVNVGWSFFYSLPMS